MASDLLRTDQYSTTPTVDAGDGAPNPATIEIVRHPADAGEFDPLEWLNANLEAWEARVRARYKEPTARGKLSRLRQFVEWALGVADVELAGWRSVTPELVDRYVEHRLNTPGRFGWNGAGEKPVKPHTVQTDLQAVRIWLEWNEEREMTGPIRSQYLRGRVKAGNDADQFSLTPEQQEWLLKRAWWIERGQRTLRFTEPGTGRRKAATCTDWFPRAFHAFVRLGLELGLRPRELFWLAWEDFTDNGGQVVLEIQSHYDGAGRDRRVINEVKTQQSRRKLVVPAGLWDELTELRESMRDVCELHRFLFAVVDGRKACGWRKPVVHFAVKALKEELGDNRFRLNTLRKSCGRNLRDRGLDYFAIAQFLGHTPEVCMRNYVKDCRDEEAFDPATCKPVRLSLVSSR